MEPIAATPGARHRSPAVDPGPRWMTWALPAAALLIIGCTLTWFGYDDRRNVLAAESRRLDSLARVAEGQVSGRLLNLQTLLKLTADDVTTLTPANRSGFNTHLAGHRAAFPLMRSLVVADASGRVIHSATPNLLGFDASDRDYFRAHADNPRQAAFYISQPFNTVSGGIGVAASMAIRDRNGKLVAVVVSGIDPAYFQSVLTDIRPEEGDGIAVLANAAGAIIARVPHPESYVGKNIAGNKLLQALLLAEGRSITGAATAASDGVERLYAMHRMSETGLVVIVGRDLRQVLANWRQDVLIRAAIFLFTVGVVAGLALMIRRQQRIRLAAEAEARRSAEFANAAIAALPGVFYVLGKDGCFVHWNTNFERLTGYDSAEMRGKPALEVIAEPDRGMVAERIAEVFETGDSYAEADLLARNGQRMTHYFTGRRVMLDGLPHLVGLGIDVSARKQLEARAFEMAELNGRILYASPVGIITYEAESGHCVLANAAAARLLGCAPESLLQQNYHSLRSWRNSGLYDAAKRALASDATVRHEVHTVSSFGKDVWLDAQLSKFSLGGETHLLTVFEDLGTRRQAEEEQAYALIDSSAQATLVVDVKRGESLLFANTAAELLFGFAHGKMAGLEMRHLIPGLPAVAELAEPAMQVQRSDGSDFSAEITVSRARLAGREVMIVSVQDISARLRAEAALRESEQRWKFALEGAGDGVWDWNLETGRITYSARSRELLGLTADVPENDIEAWRQRVEPDDMRRAMVLLEDYLDGQRANYEAEYRIDDGKGGWRWLLSRGMVVRRSEDGRPQRMIGTFADITDRKTAAETLARNEAQLRLLLDSTAEAIFGVDRDGRCTFSNTACLHLLGCDDASQLLGQDMFSLLRLDSGGKDRDPWRFRNGEHVHFDNVTLQRFDGRPFQAEVWLFPQQQQGTVSGAVVTFFDISERLAAQNRLITLSSAVEASSTAIVITNPAGMIEYANARFCEITGYLPNEVVGRNMSIVKSGRMPDSFFTDLWQTISAGRHWRGEVINRKKSGELYLEQMAITPIMDDGRILHYVALKEDITADREAAEELRRAKVAADAANQAKSEFLANMSHEIRTPMNAIVGLSHLCLETELTPKQHDYLRKINSSAKSLHRILNDILDFSKVEAGRLELESVNFSLAEVIDNLNSIVAARADEKELELRLELAPDVPHRLLGDPYRLGQVLINLVSNAIKFTDAGEVVLRVDKMHEDTQGTILRFTVSDTGIGMSEEQVGRLFSAFTQADTSITRRFGGTGLGLAICKRLTELMGGSISASSRPGRGSMFVVELPLKKATAIADKTRARGEEALAAICGAHLLVAEDNEINQQVTRELLEMLGITVDVASNGQEAVQMALSNPYDGILMDVAMPVMDGISATRELRRHSQLAGMPIIATTAAASASDVASCRQAGMNDHVSKPIELSELMSVLARWIRPRTPRSPESLAPRKSGHSAALPILPGVNVVESVARMGGSLETYHTVLLRLRNNQSHVIEDIRSSMRANNRSKAERLAHTLKSLAATIGAERLQKLVRDLEEGIRRADDSLVDRLCPRIEQELAQLFAAIDALPAPHSELLPPPQAGEWKPPSPGDLVDCLRHARQELAQFNAAAEDTLLKLAKMVGGDAMLALGLAEVRKLVASYDYVSALAALDDWAAQLEQPDGELSDGE